MSNPSPHIGLLCLQPPDWNGSAAAKLAHGTVSCLRAHGCRVTVFAREWHPANQPEHPADPDVVILKHGRRNWPSFVHKTLDRLKPFGADQTATEVSLLRSHGGSLDWILADETYAGWLAAKASVPVLLHSHCLRSLDWAELPADTRNRKIARMLAAEPQIVRRFRHHASASARVAQKIHEWNPAAEVSLVPVTIDLKHYSFVPASDRAQLSPQANLFGSMTWAATAATGRRLLNELWPAIRAQLPNAHLQVVGRGTRQLLSPKPPNQGLELYERVEDIVPFWKKAGVLLYPCSGGSGIKLKVLEALAYGVPIVTTPSGAEGIDLVDGETAMIARTDEEFVLKSIQVLRSHELQERLRRAGRNLLETRLTTSKIASAFVDAGRQLINAKQP